MTLLQFVLMLGLAGDPVADRLEPLRALFAGKLDGAAMKADVAAIDTGWRTRGNESYRAGQQHLRERLEKGGFPAASIEVRELGREEPAWNPRAASLELLADDGTSERLVGFDSPADKDRVCVCLNSFPTREGGEVLEVVRADDNDADAAGKLVYGAADPEMLWASFQRAGARGVLSSAIEPYNKPDSDPGVIQFGRIRQDAKRKPFGFKLSPAAAKKLDAALARGPVKLRAKIAADFTAPCGVPLLLATISGSDVDAPCILVSAHLDEPGANDNASGCASAVGAAIALRAAIAAGEVPRPKRAIVFLIGQEIDGTQLWLQDRQRAKKPAPFAGISLDMTGEDAAKNGAPFLIERMPDPSAIHLRDPDRHTEWGAGEAKESDLRGHFLPDLALACAQAVAASEPTFHPTTNPFEGGSDHQPLLDRGIPAVLFWHFTDPAYHTNRDTIDQVGAKELECSTLATLLALSILASGDAADRAVVQAIVERARDQRDEWEKAHAAAHPDDKNNAWAEKAWARHWQEALASVETL